MARDKQPDVRAPRRNTSALTPASIDPVEHVFKIVAEVLDANRVGIDECRRGLVYILAYSCFDVRQEDEGRYAEFVIGLLRDAFDEAFAKRRWMREQGAIL